MLPLEIVILGCIRPILLPLRDPTLKPTHNHACQTSRHLHVLQTYAQIIIEKNYTITTVLLSTVTRILPQPPTITALQQLRLILTKAFTLHIRYSARKFHDRSFPTPPQAILILPIGVVFIMPSSANLPLIQLPCRFSQEGFRMLRTMQRRVTASATRRMRGRPPIAPA